MPRSLLWNDIELLSVVPPAIPTPLSSIVSEVCALWMAPIVTTPGSWPEPIVEHFFRAEYPLKWPLLPPCGIQQGAYVTQMMLSLILTYWGKKWAIFCRWKFLMHIHQWNFCIFNQISLNLSATVRLAKSADGFVLKRGKTSHELIWCL